MSESKTISRQRALPPKRASPFKIATKSSVALQRKENWETLGDRERCTAVSRRCSLVPRDRRCQGERPRETSRRKWVAHLWRSVALLLIFQTISYLSIGWADFEQRAKRAPSLLLSVVTQLLSFLKETFSLGEEKLLASEGRSNTSSSIRKMNPSKRIPSPRRTPSASNFIFLLSLSLSMIPISSGFHQIDLFSASRISASDNMNIAYQEHGQESRRQSTTQTIPAKKKSTIRKTRPSSVSRLAKKNDLDLLVKDLGLTPVPKQKQQKIKRKQSEQSSPFSSSTQSSNDKTSSHQSTSYSSILIRDTVDIESQLNYARNGHGVLRNFISPSLLDDVRTDLTKYAKSQALNAWRQKVEVASNSKKIAKSCQSVEDCREELNQLGITEELPFLQYFNTWRSMPKVQELAYALGETAAILLDVPQVRLYQDSVFWKRQKDGPTPFHVDARMAPFDTSHFITFWIPLHDISSTGSALQFVSKSHNDFALPYWNPIDNAYGEDSQWNRLEDRYPNKIVDYMPLSLGDVTVHSGWTLHCASANFEGKDRMALAISFVDAKAQIREDALDLHGKGDNEDQWSYKDWVKDVPARAPFHHHLVPRVWPSPKSRE